MSDRNTVSCQIDMSELTAFMAMACIDMTKTASRMN